MILSNTWATVYRGDDADAYADPTDLDAPVDGLERVPMAITELSRTVTDPESDEPRTIRYAKGRASGRLGILADDRVLDLRTNRWWVVRSISGGGFTFFGSKDLSLDLRAV